MENLLIIFVRALFVILSYRPKIYDERGGDVGFYDGIPINLALDMGATEILAVDLSVLAINKKPKDKNIKVDVIKMKDKTPLTLTFTKEYANKI